MESAAKIKEILQAASMEKLPEFIAEYENDPRSGVQKLVSSAQKKIDALEKERQRIENLKNTRKNAHNIPISAELTKWEEVLWRDR